MPGAHNNFAISLQALHRTDEAAGHYEQALVINSDDAEAHNNLGTVLLELDRQEDAVTHYRQALVLKPDYAEAHYNFAIALQALDRHHEAISHYDQALAIKPDDAVAHYNIGIALEALDRLEESITHYKQALVLRPDYVEAHNNLGAMHQSKLQLAEAVACFRKAISIDPNCTDAYSNLGMALQKSSQLDEAIACFKKALDIKPDSTAAHSNLLLTFNYHPDLLAEDVFAEYKRWNEQHARPLLPIAPAYRNNRDGGRKLKIGYISADLRSHSVAYFFEPLLKQHDRTRVEIYCYSNVRNPDEVTQRLRYFSDHWCSIVAMSDQKAADQIRHDEIDILVDLGGHTANNRLLVLARKPAPVQVSWLGYPNTTGLESIDYRFTDEIADPVGLSDELHSEELIRLENGFLSYQGTESTSDISSPSCVERGHITFGSFNNLTKVAPEVVSLWIEILRAVPGAHLLLKSKSLVEREVRERYQAMFQEGHISKDRIELYAYAPSQQDHLKIYANVDIGLDPFPYNGTTTTCEALWMGVPVITLLGDCHAGRVGASLLSQVGLDELIAADPGSYVDAAVELAADTEKLAGLRCSLRAMMMRSELCNAANFARKVEDAYAVMWKKYLSKSQS